MIFFFNADIVIQRNLTTILGLQTISLVYKYLGVPPTAQSWNKFNKEKAISSLKDSVKIWIIRALNLVGHLVLINVVIQEIFFYILSILPSPKVVFQKMREIHRNFIWCMEEDKINWVLVD